MDFSQIIYNNTEGLATVTFRSPDRLNIEREVDSVVRPPHKTTEASHHPSIYSSQQC
jgi:hypothetical protein